TSGVCSGNTSIAGRYPIVPSVTYNANNYTLTVTNGTLSVQPRKPSLFAWINYQASAGPFDTTDTTVTFEIAVGGGIWDSMDAYDNGTKIEMVRGASMCFGCYLFTVSLQPGQHSVTVTVTVNGVESVFSNAIT